MGCIQEKLAWWGMSKSKFSRNGFSQDFFVPANSKSVLIFPQQEKQSSKKLLVELCE